MKLWRALKHLFGHGDDDLRDEIELHRSLNEQRLRERGLSEAEARAESRRTMGNVALAREDARAVWIAPWIESTWQDAMYAIRMIGRSPGFAVSMILVMALGIGATATIFGLVDSLVLRSLPAREPDRLVYLSRPSFSYPLFTELRSRAAHIVPQVFGWDLDRMNVEWTLEMVPSEVLLASGDVYSTLGVNAAIGRTFGPSDDRIGGGAQGLVAVISHGAWQRRLGGRPDAIGRVIRIQRQPFTIIGVTPPGFFGVAPGLDPDVTIPLSALQTEAFLQSRTTASVHIMGRLADGLTVERADAAFQAIWPAILEATTNPGMPADRRTLYMSRTTSLASGRAGFSRVRNQFEEPLWLLFALVGVLLAVATASAANLLRARAVTRRRELAVRLAIGAGRSRIVRQLLTEALVWAVLGAAVGSVLASWGAALLVKMMTTWEDPIALAAGPNWRAAAFVLALSLLTAAACSVAPALRATRVDAGATLKEFGQIGGGTLRRWTFAPSLVILQVALTVVLLFGAGLFARNVQRILAQDTGFNRDSILVISTDAVGAGHADARITLFYAELLKRLGALSGVESASLSLYPPISDEDGAWTQSVSIADAPVERDPVRQVYFNAVSPGFFATIGIPVLKGRDFAVSDDGTSPRVAIINVSLARRLFSSENPIGRRISIGRDQRRQTLEIVGVVTDAKYQNLKEQTRSIAYLSHAQHPAVLSGENLFAELRVSGPLAPAAEHVRQAIRALDGSVPIRIQTVDDRIAESLVRERVIAFLAAALGVSALLLACAALYGLLAYMVSRRTNEIGLRLALGARRVALIAMVIRQSMLLAGLGVVVGLGLSLASGRFARHVLYQISPTDPVSLAAAALLMMLVAIAAALLPARRASRVDPLVALRSE